MFDLIFTALDYLLTGSAILGGRVFLVLRCVHNRKQVLKLRSKLLDLLSLLLRLCGEDYVFALLIANRDAIILESKLNFFILLGRAFGQVSKGARSLSKVLFQIAQVF